MTSAEDAKHSGHPLTCKTDENVDPVKEHVLKDRRVTIREVSDMLEISFGLARGILEHNLWVVVVRVKFTL